MEYIRWFRYALIGAAGIVLLSLAMLIVSPTYQDLHWVPDGFFTPIMVFEFMQSDADASRFFAGDSGFISSMKWVVLLDMGFLLSYGLFLSLCAMACYQLSRQWYLLIAVGLACAGALFDVLENLQLLAIIDAQQGLQPFTGYGLLAVFVNAKFISLSLASVLIAPVIRQFGRRGRVFLGCSVVSIIGSLVNLVQPAYSAEIVLLSTTIAWIALMLIALRVPRIQLSTAADTDPASGQTSV